MQSRAVQQFGLAVGSPLSVHSIQGADIQQKGKTLGCFGQPIKLYAWNSSDIQQLYYKVPSAYCSNQPDGLAQTNHKQHMSLASAGLCQEMRDRCETCNRVEPKCLVGSRHDAACTTKPAASAEVSAIAGYAACP